ncbi:MAG: STAS domain-containing protein, partial [Desulfatirhabdiaceae bacterium]
MQLIQEKKAGYLLIHVMGRLDATWYDFFLETILKYIRNGEHHLIIDASEMSYISSMGIRALMI